VTHYRRRDLPFRLPRGFQGVSIRPILLAFSLFGAGNACATTALTAQDAPAGMQQSTYDPLTASVDLFVSNADAPRLWVRGKDDYERA